MVQCPLLGEPQLAGWLDALPTLSQRGEPKGANRLAATATWGQLGLALLCLYILSATLNASPAHVPE